jgi:hypothetical protein
MRARLASSRVGPLLLDPRHASLFRDLTDILGARLHTVFTDLTRQELSFDRRRQSKIQYYLQSRKGDSL